MMKSLYKRAIQLVLIDALCICIAWFGAYWLRFNLSLSSHRWLPHAALLLPLVILVQLLFNWRYSLHRIMSRYVSIQDLIRIIKSVIMASVLCLVLFYFTDMSQYVPRVVVPLYGLLAAAMLSGSRLFVRLLLEWRAVRFSSKHRVLVVGAGQAAEGLIRDLRRSHGGDYDVVCVVDDDPNKRGLELHGVRVDGTLNDISDLLHSCAIDLVFIAIPSIPSLDIRRIYAICKAHNKSVSTLPALRDIAEGRISTDLLRPIQLEDLLDRNVNIPHLDQVEALVRDKVVLVTGGGGSIGSELCHQIMAYAPRKLIICDHSEFALYSVLGELKKSDHVAVVPCLCGVANEDEVEALFHCHAPDIVFHAAAYKHVPMLESQVLAAAKNNIMGTSHVAKMAAKYQAKKFVLVSTDKAVNPTNIMGMTKRAAEFICQSVGKGASTDFMVVRFGNVLGSAGSVIPLFKKQLLAGGPITVTHPDITRYFMTIPEAASLILKAMSVGGSGDLYTLNMGEPVKIQFLAEKLIELSGKKLGVDVSIEYTGLRPGEKLYEELHYDFEQQSKVSEKLFLVNAGVYDEAFVESALDTVLQGIVARDELSIVAAMQQLVGLKQVTKVEGMTSTVG
jgi:FlaA1/EpsC-like NDP-sugar epimerase